MTGARRSAGLMPISRAPVRLTAVARSALPRSVRSKNSHSSTISAAELPRMMTAWPLSVSGPRLKRASQNGGLRNASAPKNSSPRPVSAKCTPTETISSTSTDASASRWYANRYTSGPSGVTMASVSNTCDAIGQLRGCASAHTSTSANGSASVVAASRHARAGWPWRQARVASIAAAMSAVTASSHSVPGRSP